MIHPLLVGEANSFIAMKGIGMAIQTVLNSVWLVLEMSKHSNKMAHNGVGYGIVFLRNWKRKLNNMKDNLKMELWNKVKSTYPSGTSKHTNALLEEDFDSFLDEVVKICAIPIVGKRIYLTFADHNCDSAYDTLDKANKRLKQIKDENPDMDGVYVISREVE